MRLSALAPEAFEAAFRAWRAGSGPLLPYVKSTPFVSLARFGGDMDLAADVAAPACPDLEAGELAVVDLPAAESLAAGLRLWAERRLWPVVTFGTFYHPHGMVGDRETAGLLLAKAPAADAEPEGWCLLTDHRRYVDGPLPAGRFNNQYELTEDDLPSAEELRALGITGVCLWSAEPAKEDLQRYAVYLSEAQLKVRWHV